MRFYTFSIFSLCALAMASPELERRNDPETNNTLLTKTTAISSASAPYNTGDSQYSTTSGIFNNSTSTAIGGISTASATAHHSSSGSAASSSSSAGSAPTGVWGNAHVNGAIAGAVGVFGLALAL